MCIFILGFMALLLYHLMTSVGRLQLAEVVDGLIMPLAEGWDVLLVLWPALAFSFLGGIFCVLIIMRLWVPKAQHDRSRIKIDRCDTK